MRSHRSLSVLLVFAALLVLAAMAATAAAPAAVAPQPAVAAPADCAAPSAAASAPIWNPAAVATPLTASLQAADAPFGFVNPSFCPPQCGDCAPGQRCGTPCHFESGCRICSCF